jgi:hypothetical protein
VENLSTFNIGEFGVINRMNTLPGKEYYQMGEEGNKPDPYELQSAKIKRLVFRDFTISTRYPNNVVLVRGNSINMGVCCVSDLRYDVESDSFKATVSPFAKQGDFYTGIPCNSSAFNIYLVSGGVDHSKKEEIDARLIVTQFVCLPFKKHVAGNPTLPSSSSRNARGGQRLLDKGLTSWVCTPLMHSILL